MTEWTVAILPSDRHWGQPRRGRAKLAVATCRSHLYKGGCEAFPAVGGSATWMETVVIQADTGAPGLSVSLSIPPPAWGPCGLGGQARCHHGAPCSPIPGSWGRGLQDTDIA